ncbi:serine hydrolase [Lacticaseibacillus sp. GG6-2]
MKNSEPYFKPPVRYALWGLCILVIVGLLGFRAHLLHAQQAEPAKQTQTAAKKLPAKATASDAQIQSQLMGGWQKIIAQTDLPVSIAVYSKQYGLTVAYNSQPKVAHTTASIVKVAMLTQLLHTHRQAGATLTNSEVGNAEQAIQNSDNAAATNLYRAIGSGRGLTSLFTNLKMTQSHAYASGWVATTTTASDQLRLLNQIFYAGDYLSTKSQAYIQDLMSKVEPDQQWGISAGAKQYQLKNGWRLNGDNTWIVNSIGHLGSGDKSCTIAILTDHNQSLKSGQQFVAKLAKVTGETLMLQ